MFAKIGLRMTMIIPWLHLLVASAATYYRDLGVVSMAAPPIAVCSGRGRTTGLIISVELPQCFDAALNVLIRYVVTELNI